MFHEWFSVRNIAKKDIQFDNFWQASVIYLNEWIISNVKEADD